MSPSLRLGRYVAEGLLGPGGVTETYLARLAEGPETARNQLFALKLLREDRVPEAMLPEVARRFTAAGEQLHGFRRPGFGKVVDVSGEAGATFIVSEYVAGLDLARLAAMFEAESEGRAGMDPVLAGLLGAEIARLLQVGHTAKPAFPHLGLAPHNVIISEAGEVFLLDAGIAAAIRSITEQPEERWRFVAPELLAVDVGAAPPSGRQGVAADLYALGALLSFLVTGRPPRDEPESGAPPTTDGLAVACLSSQLAAALRQLLATDPGDRPESAAVLVDWLSAGAGSARERQRLLGEAMRAAEEEARRAAAERARRAHPPPITVPMMNDAGKGRTGKVHSGRWLLWALVSLSMVVLAAGSLFLVWPAIVLSGGGAGLGGGPGATAESGAGEATDERTPAPRLAAHGDSAPTRAHVLGHLTGRLVAETLPPGATVWVDGVARGTTFADITVGPGTHRVVLTLPGFRTFRDTVDTGRGVVIRRTLVAVPPESRSGGHVRVECGTLGKYPILLDDLETGDLCPALAVPTTVGKHTVGIYLPGEDRVVSVGVTVEPGGRPARARFNE